VAISDQLRQLIEDSNKSRYRIAQETGVSESVLSRFIHGQTDITLSNVDLVCKLLGARLTTDAPRVSRGTKKTSRKITGRKKR